MIKHFQMRNQNKPSTGLSGVKTAATKGKVDSFAAASKEIDSSIEEILDNYGDTWFDLQDEDYECKAMEYDD